MPSTVRRRDRPHQVPSFVAIAGVAGCACCRPLRLRGCRSGVSPPGRLVVVQRVGGSFHVARPRCLDIGAILGHASLGAPSFWCESGLADANCAPAFVTPCACACIVAAVGGNAPLPPREHGPGHAKIDRPGGCLKPMWVDALSAGDAGCGHRRGLPLSDRVAVLLGLADPCLARGVLSLAARGEAASAG
jgi:hypothetical protein